MTSASTPRFPAAFIDRFARALRVRDLAGLTLLVDAARRCRFTYNDLRQAAAQLGVDAAAWETLMEECDNAASA